MNILKGKKQKKTFACMSVNWACMTRCRSLLTRQPSALWHMFSDQFYNVRFQPTGQDQANGSVR